MNPGLHWLGQSAFRIHAKDAIIYIDPCNLTFNAPKATFILITHFHTDHFSEKAIKQLSTNETKVYVPGGLGSYLPVRPGDIVNVNAFINFEVVPAYNIHKSFHPKHNKWVGYIVDIEGTRIYHAGDTDLIPEMNNMKVDIALLPIGGTFTMDYREAIEAVKIIKPKTVIPMHYGSVVGTAREAQEFVKICQTLGFHGEILKVEH